MASYTTNLRLTLPSTGEYTNTWGTVVNDGITTLVDQAIAGYVSIAMTDANYTLTTASGAIDQARRMMINLTGTLSASRNVICPSTSKVYFVRNNTTGGFPIVFKTSSGTGVSVPNGLLALLVCDGTDVVSGYGGAALINYVPAGTGAVTTTVQNKLREIISVKDFGAVGDGVTNDTAAIQAAITAAANSELIFPAGGTYLSGPLTVANTMAICIEGTLKMKDSSGILLTISGDDVTLYGSGQIDLNNTQHKGVYITGQRPHVHDLTFKNMLGGAATSGTSSALSIDNVAFPRVHDLKFRSIQKGTAPAPYVSQPRAMSLDFVSGMLCADVLYEDVYCGIGAGNVIDSQFNNLSIDNSLAITDNAIYAINCSNVEFNDVHIDGWVGEPIVFSACTDVYFNGGEIVGTTGNASGFENSTRIGFRGTRFRHSDLGTIFKSRVANTSSTGVIIENIRADVSGTDDILGFYNGATNDLTIRDNVFVVTHDTGKTFNNRFLTLTNTDAFIIDNNTWVFKEIGAAAAADFLFTLVCSAYSSFKGNRLFNRTALGRYRVNGLGALVAADDIYKQSNLDAGRNANYALTTAEPREFWGTSAPTVGTFNAGDKVWNTGISSAGGPMGWVCVTAGTPGTWTPFGSGTLIGSTTYNPPSLAAGAVTTTTVTVTGAALGDIAVASFGLDLQGISLTAYVSSANIVTVQFWNSTTGTLDLAQSTLRARVWKS